jgi:hypothetical protein
MPLQVARQRRPKDREPKLPLNTQRRKGDIAKESQHRSHGVIDEVVMGDVCAV